MGQTYSIERAINEAKEASLEQFRRMFVWRESGFRYTFGLAVPHGKSADCVAIVIGEDVY